MDPVALSSDLQTIGQEFLSRALELIQPIVLAQFGAVAVLFLVAHLAAARLGPRIQNRLRALPDKRVSRLRIPLLLVRYLRPILFVLLAWLVVYVMRQVTWPSRSYYIALAAGLVSA